jgi:hypothetical protein
MYPIYQPQYQEYQQPVYQTYYADPYQPGTYMTYPMYQTYQYQEPIYSYSYSYPGTSYMQWDSGYANYGYYDSYGGGYGPDGWNQLIGWSSGWDAYSRAYESWSGY